MYLLKVSIITFIHNHVLFILTYQSSVFVLCFLRAKHNTAKLKMVKNVNKITGCIKSLIDLMSLTEIVIKKTFIKCESVRHTVHF